MQKPHKDYDPEGMQTLANAIVVTVCKSYRKSLRSLKKNPKNRAAMKEALDCEEFFSGDWIKVLTNVDGEWLRDQLRQEAQRL